MSIVPENEAVALQENGYNFESHEVGLQLSEVCLEENTLLF